ncbi:hypothetical protein Mgra_00001427 [Meloidogyne graminicola]|uniref:Uncharacterized protein n=1 Tax=Meloidogyne graminicola TaxID=189291 RepID=A0A8T0A005_9BILA|nr:hypothetical protein Mgra_00001427 [Meloidogyne graminicola]
MLNNNILILLFTLFFIIFLNLLKEGNSDFCDYDCNCCGFGDICCSSNNRRGKPLIKCCDKFTQNCVNGQCVKYV